MSHRAPGDDLPPFVIRVTVETAEPLTGTAAGKPGEAIRFEGWLGLLNALSTLVGPRPIRPRRPH
jgi:hypothetical protein